MSVYFDNNATTPLHDKVYAAMEPYLKAVGNASSLHRYGRYQRDAVEQARAQVAKLSGAQPEQVIFTSGGTESNNLILKGLSPESYNAHMAVSAIEHASVLEPAKQLASDGNIKLSVINVEVQGVLDIKSLQQVLDQGAGLVSVMLANNETGVIQNIQHIAEVVSECDSIIHTDASQAAGKIPLSFSQLGVHAMTLSSHKIYGPMGAGALIIDRALPLHAIIQGGGHEHHFRAGTENIAAIVGFGAAAELAFEELEQRKLHAQQLVERLEAGLRQSERAVIFSGDVKRIPNTVQFGVPSFEGETLLMQLDKKGFAVSSGSACTSGKNEPSHVLQAMGIAPDIALGAIRVSFGFNNSLEQVDVFLDALNEITAIKDNNVMMAACV